MKFAHLPISGGLYDQHPELIEKWEYIFSEKSKEEERKAQDQERQMKRGKKWKK